LVVGADGSGDDGVLELAKRFEGVLGPCGGDDDPGFVGALAANLELMAASGAADLRAPGA
jgi:hypothetical protein